MTKRLPMTVTGAKKLREELDYLQNTKRQEIIATIAESRAHGDLKENAEYHAAREQQAFVEGRIREIESKLFFAHIIDISKIPYQDKVIFGSTIDLTNLETQQQTCYQIVGENEASIEEGKISVVSPLARALISKSTGDIVTVQAPAGMIQYEITQIRYQ